MEAALKEVTGSEVHVDYKDGKGSLKIDFYSDDMLQKFVSLLGMYDPENCGVGADACIRPRVDASIDPYRTAAVIKPSPEGEAL